MNLLSGLGLKILGGLAAIATVAAILLGARQAGRNAERVEVLQRQLNNARVAHDVEIDLRGRDGSAAERLRANWSRD